MHIPNTLPRLHTFISYREEHFGGYAFNPYLLRELPLTRFEFAVLICCEQGEPGGAATAGLARRFGLPRKEAARQIQATLDKLDAYFALRQASADSGARVVPGVGYPPENNETAECASTLPTAYLSAPLSIIWEITHACNLHCMHCLSACGKPAAGELTTAEAQALIDELARRRVFSMTLGGGEPLVRSDVYDLIAYATSKHLCVRLSTNGYAVDDETLRRLAHLNVFSVQVSVDGAEATHNRIRGRPDAFEKALHALQRFGDAGYHTFMTVTANALNVAEIPDLAPLAVRLGVATFKVSPYVPLGRARDHEDTLKLPPTALEELARALREQQRRWGRRLGFQIEGLFPWLLEPPAPGQRTAPAFGPGCSAGISQVVVSYDGEVYPCPYMRAASAGNVRETPLDELWHDTTFFAPLRNFDPRRLAGKCRTCAYRPAQCSGGCRGAALAAYGDLYAEDPNCWLEQRETAQTRDTQQK